MLISFFGFFIGTLISSECSIATDYFDLTDYYYLAGIVSGLFSVLAFLGVLHSLYLQNKERIKQQGNFDRQLEEQDRHASQQINNLNNQLEFAQRQFAQQTKYDEIKRFEDTFFKMVSLQLEIVNGLEYTSNNSHEKEIHIKGREVFQYFFESRVVLDHNSPNNPCFGMQGVLTRYGIKKYTTVGVIDLFDHYFRYLYRIIRFVHEYDEEIISPSQKQTYIANNIRGTLSSYELIWLFYNCLSEVGFKHFKPLVEEYHLLKNIREANLPMSDNIRHVVGYYSPLSPSFPQNEYEFYLDLDNTNIPKKYDTFCNYKLQAFYSESEISTRLQFYLDIRDNGLTRDEATAKYFNQN